MSPIRRLLTYASSHKARILGGAVAVILIDLCDTTVAVILKEFMEFFGEIGTLLKYNRDIPITLAPDPLCPAGVSHLRAHHKIFW